MHYFSSIHFIVVCLHLCHRCACHSYLEHLLMVLIYSRVLTVHGSMDKIVPVEDAMEFAKFIPNHKLQIIQGADHEYTSHQDELASVVLNFILAQYHQDRDMRGKLTLCTGIDRVVHSRL